MLEKKAWISRYLSIPIDEIEQRLTLADIDKYFAAAAYIFDMEMSPFKDKIKDKIKAKK